MFAKNLFKSVPRSFTQQTSRLFSTQSKVFKAFKQPSWKVYSFAALGFTFSSYYFSQNLNLDEFYEVSVIADWGEGEARAVQVGPKEEDAVLVVKHEGKYYAVSNKCSHFGFPLSKGTLFDDKVTCPLHNAQFSIKTGAHEYGPVFNGLETFEVTERDGKIHIKVSKEKLNKSRALPMSKKGDDARRFVIVGGGVAGLSAAETLRQSGFEGEITIISDQDEAPYDRTMLSKSFQVKLQGITVRSEDFLKDFDINLVKNTRVQTVNTKSNFVQTKDGKHIHYDQLLVATGASPRIPKIPGTSGNGVFSIRNWNDVQGVKSQAEKAKNIVIIGASFIGLESASCLKDFLKEKNPNINITVCDIASVPYERVLGQEVGGQIQKFHENNGIKFNLQTGISSIDVDGDNNVTGVQLSNGQKIDADLVVIGAGVAPNTQFLQNVLPLARDGGIETDFFQKAKTTQNVFAAGDVAKYPYWFTGERVRIEHYNEAIHQGYIAALNMLGKSQANDHIPYFWTRFHGQTLGYTGHATKFDEVYIDGDLKEQKFVAYYSYNNQIVAAAAMGKMNSIQIINEAMKQSALPKLNDLKMGRVTLDDVMKRVKSKGKKCGCKKKQQCSKNMHV